MSLTTSVIRHRPTIVFQLGVIMLVPWAWAAFIMPSWASAVCGGLTIIGVFLAVRFLVAPTFARRRAGDESLRSEEIVKMRSSDPSVVAVDLQTIHGDLGSLHTGLSRWQKSSSVSSIETATARERVTEVISQTERAVLALTLSFRGITSKTRQQMEAAMSLLQRNAEQASISPGSWLSLPDYIHAYETQLHEVVEGMIGFSAVSDELLQHQKKVREHSVLIDELVDELRSMALRTGRLALDSSVAAGESGGQRGHLVELTDSIRQISDQTHGLTRTVRKTLEMIGDELAIIYKVINNAARTAKESALRAKADMAQLNLTMIDKTREVEDSLAKINGLGEAIQQDVNNAIVAMQFQDITQQKLENMRGNILVEVMRNLDSLSVETQEMMTRDIFLAIKQEAVGLNASAGDRVRTGPGAGRQTAAESTQTLPADPEEARAGANRGAAATRVELF
jgi:methyl-accepting chemotaxis protein